MAKGWIRIYRQLQDCEIWTKNQPFDMRSAWIDLLMFANHEDKQIIFDYKPIIVKRGQYLTSVRKLSARWKWDKERTLKYLRLLEQLGMITKDSNNRRTLITIENYEKYQGWQDTEPNTEPNTTPYTERTLNERSTATNNNDNNDNNDNNIPPISPKGKTKHRYGAYKHVLLTDEEIERLNNEFGQLIVYDAIQILDDYIEMKGAKYKNHNLVLRKWAIDRAKQERGNRSNGNGNTGRASDSSESDEERVREQVRRIESGEEPDERPFADMP